jgi:hypothetical protein
MISLTWLPRLGLLPPLDVSQVPATSKSFAAPGSLRDAHDAASAWFFGPKAENANYFKMYVETILNDVAQCRRNFAPEDEVGIYLSPPQDDLIIGDYSGLYRCRDCLIAWIQEEYVQTTNQSHAAFWTTLATLCSFLLPSLHSPHGERRLHASDSRISHGANVQSQQHITRGWPPRSHY